MDYSSLETIKNGGSEIIRLAVFVLLSWVLVVPGLAGIRGTEWGMSDAEIKKLEGKPEVEDDDHLVYSDDLGGVKTQVVYRFNHRRELYSIEYHLHLEQPFMATALSQFDKISEILHTNYGPPDEGSRHADREKRLGLLAMEKPVEENWSRDSTTYVSHSLTPGRSYRHVLIYGHREMMDEYEAFLKQKAKEKL